MRDVIPARWIEFTEPLEGGVAYPYADIRGLITIAYGNLCDPMSTFLVLPLVHPDGSLATTAEKATAWLAVKGDPRAATKGHLYARGLTTLRLTRQGMTDLALGKLEANDRVLQTRFPDWAEFPACAQMALHSLSWACGAGFHFPRLISACNARDWDAASVHIQMRETTPEGLVNAGLRPRNSRNRILMMNAQRVQGFGLDPDLLEWDAVLGVQDADTQPDISLPSSIPPPLPNLGAIVEEFNEPPNAASQPTIHPDPSAYLRPVEWLSEPGDDDPEAA